MYLAMKRCVCVVSVCITEYQSYSPKISIPVPTPADSGATPAESGDSFRNQWGTEKYCSKGTIPCCMLLKALVDDDQCTSIKSTSNMHNGSGVD